MKWTHLLRLLPVALAASPLAAQGMADSVVLRVTSPRGEEVTFSGVVTFRDGKTERRIENVRTPFELRVAAEDLDARFTAADGGALSGEIVAYRAGKQHGHATGTTYVGAVNLHFDPRRGFGFGERSGWRRVAQP
jgi:hypothetical protein